MANSSSLNKKAFFPLLGPLQTVRLNKVVSGKKVDHDNKFLEKFELNTDK